MPEYIDFYYDSTAFTLEDIEDNGVVLNQGQMSDIRMRFFFTGINSSNFFDYVVMLNIERPNGSSTNNVATVPVFEDGCFVLAPDDWITEFDGTLKITAKTVYQSEEPDVYGIATREIVPSAEQSLSTIEDFQYQALQDQLNALQSIVNVDTATFKAYEAISKGNIVMIQTSDTSAGVFVARKADYSLIGNDGWKVLGMATTDVLPNEIGTAKTRGIISGIDTSALTEAQAVFLSSTTAGAFTSNPPVPTISPVVAGVCLYSHSLDGIILVKVSTPSAIVAGVVRIGDVDGYHTEAIKQYIIATAIDPFTVYLPTSPQEGSIVHFVIQSMGQLVKFVGTSYLYEATPEYEEATIVFIYSGGAWTQSVYSGKMTGIQFENQDYTSEYSLFVDYDED